MSNALKIKKDIPLASHPEDNVIRVGQTRVSLDSVIYSFEEGSTPEEIVQQYSALSLSDVYQVIGYYLKNKDEVWRYLNQRKNEAEKLRNKCEKNRYVKEIRNRLLANKANETE
ncbi:MAG: DUF433 domain-containing protein [bacterium]